MWRLVATALLIAGSVVGARANDGASGLESCFQAARLADAICSRLENDPVQRLDCFQKTRAAQLECLEHVLSELSPKATTPEPPSGSVRPGPPASSAPPLVPSEAGSSKEPARPETAEAPTGTVSLDQPPAAPTPNPKAVPSDVPLGLPAVNSVRPARPDAAGRVVDVPANKPAADWVVSETTSPVDYTPLLTAVKHSTSTVKDAPNTLIIRCLGQRTELLVRTEGAWAALRAGELRVDYQINEQAIMKQQWTLSPDGKTASAKDDPVGLLSSLPEDARLKITVTDRTAGSHKATFRLAGWNAIREKVGAACKWAQATRRAATDKHE
jgi:hypothetical protein